MLFTKIGDDSGALTEKTKGVFVFCAAVRAKVEYRKAINGEESLLCEEVGHVFINK